MWTPVDSSGLQWPSCQARLAGAMPSPLNSSPVQSSLVHWTPTGLQATFESPVPVQWTKSPVRVQWSPVSPVHHYLLLIDINYECYKKSENTLLNDRPDLLAIIRITSVIFR
jgi:hypothetical protein